VSFRDGPTCQIEGICTVRIKLFDEMIRELKDMRYVPQLKKKLYLSWRFGGAGPERDS